MTIYSLDVLLSRFGTSLLFYVQYLLFLLDLHPDFSGGSSGGLVFASLVVIRIVKGFGVVSKAEVDVSLVLSCFFDNPTDVGNLISGSSSFSKPSLNIWKFLVHVMLKTSLEDFERNLTGMGDECNCPVAWTLLSTALLGNWGEDWPFPLLWPLLGFTSLLTYWFYGTVI